jgi:hypothetical protein
VVTRIWQQFGHGAAADELLVGLLADGDGGIPGFALLTAGTDGQHRIFCRGAVGATVVRSRAGEGEATSERVAGTGLLTWREEVVADVERIFLGEPPADTSLRLPATSGVLLAGCVVIDFTDLARRETVAYEPEVPVKRPKKTIVFFPDTITVPPPEGDVGQAPEPAAVGQVRPDGLEPASAPPPPPFTPAPADLVGTAVVSQPPVTAPAFPAAPPPPPQVPQAAEPGGGMNDGASAANGAAGNPNGANPNGDQEYDFFWGATQARSVEDAAVRDPGNGGAPPAVPPGPPPPSRLWSGPDDPVQPGGMVPSAPGPGAPLPGRPSAGPPEQPGPPGGLIDVPPWLAGSGESAPTIQRGALPGPAAMTTPPDRIGPVVPALICANGHVNPPSDAACRRCGTPLPHDPVPVPRPVLGVLRLSFGDVITLDRGVVMGRNPRGDFADPDGSGGPGSEERPHVVKLPSADGDISRTHLRVTLDGWHVLVTDLNSTNGTLVTLPGRDPQQLRPGEPTPIQPGTVVTLAEAIDFRYEVTD